MKSIIMILFLAMSALVYSQNGQIKGRVIDNATGEAIPFAKVTLEVNGSMKYGVRSDIEGYFLIANVLPGEYQLRIRYVGYDTIEQNVIIKPNATTVMEYELATDLPCICKCEFNFRTVTLYDRDREVGAPTQ